MKTILTSILLTATLCNVFAQQLVIDNQGHSGIVSDIFFVQGGKYLISTSDDKTVRMWDVSDGTLRKTFRFQQTAGANGKIYSSAITLDDQFLFLGGFFDKVGGDPNKMGQIRMMNLYTERLALTFEAHSNVILDMKISDKGDRMVTTSADHTIKLWDISDLGENSAPILLATIESPVLPNCVAINPRGTILLVGDSEGYVRSYDIEFPNNIDSDKAKIHTDEVRAIAFDHAGQRAYSTGDDGKVLQWSGEGRFLGVFAELPGAAGVIALSENDEYLTVMGRVGIVYDVASQSPISTFAKHTNSVSAICTAPFGSFDGKSGHYVASAGGDDKNILIWEITSSTQVRDLVGSGKSIYAVGAGTGMKIGLGQSNPTGNLNDTRIEKVFNLSELRLQLDKVSQLDYKRAKLEGNGNRLTKEGASSLGIGNAILPIDESTDGELRSYSYVQNDAGIIVGSSFSLKKYTAQGDLLGSYEGHEGETWAVAEMKEEEFLLSGNGDQTIKIWNINTGENLLSLFVATDNEWVIWTPQGFYEASAGGEKYIGWHINKGGKKLAEFHDVSAFRDHFHRRDVIKRIIELKNFEAVASEMGLSLKPEKEIVPPEIEWVFPVAANSIVKGNSTTLSFRITSKHPVTKVKLLANGRPIVNQKNLNISGDMEPETLELELTIPNGSSGEYEVSLYVMDDKSKISGTDKKITFEKPKMTGFETQKVVAKAEPAPSTTASTASAGARSRLTLDPVDDSHATPKNLYVVSIGISEFINPTYNLNFAEADASSISEMWKKQYGKLYDNVKSIKITDKEATKDRILQTFAMLEKGTTMDDLVVVFMASHGMNVNNRYFFLPHDGNGNNPKATCVDWKDFSNMVGNIPAKTVIFIDTCHSGQLGSSIGPKEQDNTEAVREMSSKEYGVVVMAAATGYEYSLEHPDWGHGAFTLALLEGLGEGKADIKPDGIIYLRELDYYLAERVRELTGGRQHPTTQKPSSISRLPLAGTN